MCSLSTVYLYYNTCQRICNSLQPILWFIHICTTVQVGRGHNFFFVISRSPASLRLSICIISVQLDRRRFKGELYFHKVILSFSLLASSTTKVLKSPPHAPARSMLFSYSKPHSYHCIQLCPAGFIPSNEKTIYHWHAVKGVLCIEIIWCIRRDWLGDFAFLFTLRHSFQWTTRNGSGSNMGRWVDGLRGRVITDAKGSNKEIRLNHKVVKLNWELATRSAWWYRVAVQCKSQD